MPVTNWPQLRCIRCATILARDDLLHCPSCGAQWFAPEGVPLYLDSNSLGSSDNIYERLYARENALHYLYWVRTQALKTLLTPFLDVQESPLRVLDIGCGTGYVLTHLKEFGTQAVGLESCARPLKLAQQRGLTHLYGGTAENLPFADDQFDLAISLDVFEHVKDDVRAMQEARRVLTKNGRLVVFVPAGPALWSWCDEIQGHYRRYRRGELIERLMAAGFIIERTTFLFPLFYFPALVIRTVSRRLFSEAHGRAMAFKEYSMPPPWLNFFLRSILWIETKGLLRLNYPFGITLAALARRAN